MNRPNIGVSACLLGQTTRYDAADATAPEVVAWLSERAVPLPLCPEVGAGAPVPRPPIRLTDGGLRAVERDRPEADVTGRLRAWFETARPSLSPLSGAILKSRSPSCGVADTPLPDGSLTAGLFARWLREAYPDLPLIDEKGMADDALRTAWWGRVVARHGD